tara:strand:- start:28251 stop:29642 length:1392 start_codon:yes stop_codon:yes gene_type:complete
MIGFSEGFHDAAISVVKNGRITYASHAERYSRKKHDKRLTAEQATLALELNGDDTIAFYEKTGFLKRSRQWFAGQFDTAKKERVLALKPTVNHYHHLSHAAAAFQTSKYDEAACVVVDSIGEWDTASIWKAKYENGVAKYYKKWNMCYPRSIGLWYSALTDYVGLKPLDEEYIFMGMSAFGKPCHTKRLRRQLWANNHKGIRRPINGDHVDIAASAQVVLEEELTKIFKIALKFSDNICYGGGVALNCVANSKLQVQCDDNLWIMPNPGDAGGSLGAALLSYGKRVPFSPYLGYNIEKPCDPKEVVEEILKTGLAGVANGRAEFGPRALGNRSLLADPRKMENKRRVNDIKKRQRFRPFAPAILEEHAVDYFDMPRQSRHMSYVYSAKRGSAIPACIHVDNTARVQTVPKISSSVIRPILECWYERTGCPVLLNTSLNIRGMPMVNTIDDAVAFSTKYDVRVF